MGGMLANEEAYRRKRRKKSIFFLHMLAAFLEEPRRMVRQCRLATVSAYVLVDKGGVCVFLHYCVEELSACNT